MADVECRGVDRGYGVTSQIYANEVQDEQGWMIGVTGGSVDDDITVTLCIGKDYEDGKCRYLNASLTADACQRLMYEMHDVLESLKEELPVRFDLIRPFENDHDMWRCMVQYGDDFYAGYGESKKEAKDDLLINLTNEGITDEDLIRKIKEARHD